MYNNDSLISVSHASQTTITWYIPRSRLQVLPGTRLLHRGRVTFDWAIEIRKDRKDRDYVGAMHLNKFLEHSIFPVNHHIPILQANLLDSLQQSYRSPPTRAQDVVLLYLEREQKDRELSRADQSALAATVKAHLGINIQFVRLDHMSMREQLRMSATADGMIGVHGNALTHSAWLPPHGIVVEIFAASFHHYDYQVLSEMTEHHYVGIRCQDPYVYRRGSRWGEAFGNTTWVNPAWNLGGENEMLIAELGFWLERHGITRD